MNATVDCWRPLGAALLDFHDGNTDAEIIVSSELWEPEPTPVSTFYRPLGTPLPALEVRALELCRGRVLDLGAGAGRHALELESSGLEVVAVDVLDEAVQVMRERGVSDARIGDLESLRDERFDTVLMLMNGIGIVGDLRGLGRLLETLPEHLAPGGRVVCDSADLTVVLSAEAPDLIDELEASRRYPGEVEFRLRYRDAQGPPYPWLFVDPDTLSILAAAAGFDTRIAARARRGTFVAVLTHTRS